VHPLTLYETQGPEQSGQTVGIEWPFGLVTPLTITLNGEPFDLSGPLTVTELLTSLDIDARRVAVEHNLVVIKRTAYDQTLLHDGDSVEIVNFVGGG
jgi:sulfur carrier protein